MRNILIMFLLFLLCLCISCDSNNPDNDKDVDADENIFNDSDNSETDDNFPDDLSDEALAESDEIPDDDTDEDIFERPCLPVPETGDELCFYPRKSDVPCSIPEEYGVAHILSRNKEDSYNQSWIGLNNENYFFTKLSNDPDFHMITYRCNRKNGVVEKILTNIPATGTDGVANFFDVDGNYIIFSYFSLSLNGDSNRSCYLGKMEGDWELKRIAEFDKDCHEPQVVWPYVIYREESPGWLHVYDIRTGEDRKLEGYKVYSFHHDGKKAYINAIIGTGDEAINSDIFSKGPFPSGIFEVDLETFEVIPVEIFLRKSPHAPFIYGSYLIYSTRREWTLYSSDYWSRNGMAIVLYDLFNRTETILTDTMTGNNGRAFINYPYAGWVDGSEYDGSEGGWQKVINLETDEEWVLEHNKSMADPVVMKNYSVIYFAIVGGTTVDDYEGVCVTEFHDPGKVEPNETCHDSNPCTDDIYSVT
ncbi:MAG TPA: hypothetical protein PLW78_11300, partial [bacterium]|nr:hypothetical protein [bacterium]